jgi:hypothetical protein
MNLKNHKQKLYYPAGLITLLFIPLSYLLAGYKSTASNERLLSCPFPPHIYCDPPEDDWSINKVFITVDLTSEETTNKKAVFKGKQLVKILVKSKSLSWGVRFKLCDEMKFETVVELLDIFQLEGAKIYSFYEDEIRVVNPR